MSNNKKPFIDIRRGEMAIFLVIVIGVVIGTLFKKVGLGLMLGLIIGLGIVFLNGIRAKR